MLMGHKRRLHDTTPTRAHLLSAQRLSSIPHHMNQHREVEQNWGPLSPSPNCHYLYQFEEAATLRLNIFSHQGHTRRATDPAQ